MAKRIKAAQAKLTRDEADAILRRIGDNSRAIAAIESNLTGRVEALKAAAKDKTAPLAAALKADLAALVGWAQAEKAELLAGGKRSVKMTHGVIGWRWAPSAVKVDKGVEEAELVAVLQAEGLERLLRTKVELNREAILEEPAAIDRIIGLSVERVESVYVIPSDTEVEHVVRSQKVTGAQAREVA